MCYSKRPLCILTSGLLNWYLSVSRTLTTGVLLVCVCCMPGYVYSQSATLEYRSMEYYHQQLAMHLHLEPDDLQLYPGVADVGATSPWLWNLFNAISYTDNIYYNPAQGNNFSQEYNRVLVHTKVKSTVDSCDLREAILRYDSSSVKIWNRTIGQLQDSLSSSGPLVFTADTVIYIITSDSVESPVSIVVNVNMQKALVFEARPYSEKDDQNPVLSLYTPWYLPCFMKEVYINKGNTYLSEANWNMFFGPEGTIRNLCAAIFVARDGFFTITVSGGGRSFSATSTFSSPTLLGVVFYPTGRFVGL